MAETLRSALVNHIDPIVGRRLTVETNGKGNGSKSAEIIKVEVKGFKVIQPDNPNIIVEEIVEGQGFFQKLLKPNKTGRKLSLGGNTKVKQQV